MRNNTYPSKLAYLPGGAIWTKPYYEENNWFASNRNVSGFSTEDGRVVLNPFVYLWPNEITSVLINESVRVFLTRNPIVIPSFSITQWQKHAFCDYGCSKNIRHTIIARLVANDPSAGRPDQFQKKIAYSLSKKLLIEQYRSSEQAKKHQIIAKRMQQK